MLCHAEAIKRNVAFFLWFSRGSRRLFLAGCIPCMVPGGDVNTLSDLYWRGGKNWRRGGGGGYTTGDVNNRTHQPCVCVSINLPECMCACQGPSEVQGSLQSHHSGKWRENTKGTPGHKSVCAPSLPLPLGEVIPPSQTSSSLPNFPLALVLPSIFFCGTGLWLCDSHPVTLCVCVLSSPVSLLWANLCQC